jgi:multiple sugar transport system permease protein
MKAIPGEYIEAARTDGCGNWKILSSIILPQMTSGLAALAMLVFIEYWNIVEQVVIFVKEYEKAPLSVFLSRISDGNISFVFAASCVYMFLPFYFLLIGQKNLEQGIELSGIR